MQTEYNSKKKKTTKSNSTSLLLDDLNLSLNPNPSINNRSRRTYEDEEDQREYDDEEMENELNVEENQIEEAPIETEIDNDIEIESPRPSKLTKEDLIRDGWKLKLCTFNIEKTLKQLDKGSSPSHEIKLFQEQDPPLCEFKAAWVDKIESSFPVTLSGELVGLCQENAIMHHTTDCPASHLIIPPKTSNYKSQLLMYSEGSYDDEFMKRHPTLASTKLEEAFNPVQANIRSARKKEEKYIINNLAVAEFAKTDEKYNFSASNGLFLTNKEGRQRLIEDLDQKIQDRKYFSTNDLVFKIRKAKLADANSNRPWLDHGELISEGQDIADPMTVQFLSKSQEAKGKCSVTVCIAYRQLN